MYRLTSRGQHLVWGAWPACCCCCGAAQALPIMSERWDAVERVEPPVPTRERAMDRAAQRLAAAKHKQHGGGPATFEGYCAEEFENAANYSFNVDAPSKWVPGPDEPADAGEARLVDYLELPGAREIAARAARLPRFCSSTTTF